MAEEKYTVDQRYVIDTAGRPLLVAAAAGSGKTFTLVERLMKRIRGGFDENGQFVPGENLDRFLVITYTRAAAAELRSRILKKLNEELAAIDRSGSAAQIEHLQRQVELCSRADIGTIDSICGKLLRRYVRYTAEDGTGLPPDFKVLDPDRADQILQRVLQDLLEKKYQEKDENFLLLAGSLGAGRSDKALEETVLGLYTTIRANDDPEGWLRDCREALELPMENPGQTPWGRQLLNHVAARAAYREEELGRCLVQMQAPEHEKVLKGYGKSVEGAVAALQDLRLACRAGDWDRALELSGCFPGRIGVLRNCDDPLGPVTKDAFGSCREHFVKKLPDYLPGPAARMAAEATALKPALLALLDLTGELLQASGEERRRLGTVDFSDQELMILKILRDHPELQEEVSGRWSEVMVDEYQDVNRCQDTLFRFLSHNGERLFTVGDVKQSIYRFRLADPTIFLARQRNSRRVEDTPDSADPGLITLKQNFRSAPSVINSVNAVFRSILSEELGEMEYTDSEELVHGREETAQDDFVTTLTVLSTSRGGEEPPEPEDSSDGEADVPKGALQIEARYVAGEIRRLLESDYRVPDKNGPRALRPSDVAILLRSAATAAPIFRQALLEKGVNAVSLQGGDFFESEEVIVLLSYLSVIDNPRQDVPLLAVLRSFLFGFTPDELAGLRDTRENRHCDIYTALCDHRGSSARCAAFLDKLDALRFLAPDLTVAELLERIAAEENLTLMLAALPDGEQRRGNLHVLMEEAAAYEAGGGRSIRDFIDRMMRQRAAGQEPAGVSALAADAVKILSVHRSKGLEYPVVFLCCTGRKFNRKDESRNVLIHPGLGLGSRYIDTELGARYPSLAWLAIRDRQRIENLSEEMRILYVAMTRARERLYITGTASKPEELWKKCAPDVNASRIPPQALEEDSSFLHWLLRCALLHPEHMRCILSEAPASRPSAEGGTAADGKRPAAPAPELHIRENLARRYPFEADGAVPAKITASALRPGEQEDPDALQTERHRAAARLPRFSGKVRELTEAERGTAFHLSLQYVDLAGTGSTEELREELRRLEREGRLTPEQTAAVDADKILRFYSSAVGRRILGADAVYREQRFTILEEARLCLPSCESTEKVLLQGVADCVIEEQGMLTVIDYKTGSCTEEKKQKYALQVQAYCRAMQRIHHKPVKEGLLCFIDSGLVVPVPFPADSN